MDYFSHGTTFVVRAQTACWTQQNNHCDITYPSTDKKKNALIIETAATRCTILSLDTETGVTNWFQTHSFPILARVSAYTDFIPPPSQRSADPATPLLCGWSPPCSWAPWCRRWHRVWRSGQNRTPSWPASFHRALRRGPEQEDNSNGSKDVTLKGR